MSFLLQGKSRRSRGRHRNAILQREVPHISKKNSKAGGGQIQLQRPQRTTLRNQSREVSSRNQANHKDSYRKKDMVQSSGISMEQVMEDLHILEQQQRESQRKLTQAKSLKLNRMQHLSFLENKLGDLRYRNGECRTQVNRARDVLSKSTREMEQLKLVASSDDERLKDINYKLKKALKVARSNQMYRRILDERFQGLRGREAICSRLISRFDEDLKKASHAVTEVRSDEKRLRHSISESVANATKTSEDTSKLRSEISAMAEELRSAKEMQNNTKLRADNIKLEVESDEERHRRDLRAMNIRLKEIKTRKETLKCDRVSTSSKLHEKLGELRDVWEACNHIQKEEGYEATGDPSEDGAIPLLDIDDVAKTLQDEERKVADAMNRKNSTKAKIESYGQEMDNVITETSCLKEESFTVHRKYESAHKVELGRTGQNENFLVELEKERDEVRLLNKSLNEIKANTEDELEGIRKSIAEQEEHREKKLTHLDKLQLSIAENTSAIDENNSSFREEGKKSAATLNKNRAEAEAAKDAFEKARCEVEALRSSCSEELQREINEIEKAQAIMSEESKLHTSSLLKEYPDLETVTYQFDTNLMPEERIESSLLELRKDCEERMNEFADAQNQLLSEIRQARKERKQRQDKEREEKEESVREVSEKRKLEKERAEREIKERRRVSREDRRRRKEEQEGLAVVTGKREGMKTVAAKEKKIETVPARKQRHKVVMKSVKVRTKDEEAEKCSVRTKATQHAAEASKFASHQKKKSTTVCVKSGGEAETFQKGKSIEEPWTAFEDELLLSPAQHQEAHYIANGCLTQRPGLDIPTPKSRLSHDDNIDGRIGERGRNTRARPSVSSSTCKPQHRRTSIKDGSSTLESKESAAGKFNQNEIKSSMQKRKSEKSEDIRVHLDEASRKTKRASSRRSSQESRNSLPRKRAITATTSEKEHKMSSILLDGGKKEILQKKTRRSVNSIGLSKKGEKTKSDLSLGTKGSYRSHSSRRKRSRQEITEPAQSYGISSGERLSKSRRRKPQGSDHTLRKAKSVGVMGNDFNFNF